MADAMTGQDAVTVAEAFNKDLALTGVVLTKMDGDARGGAALSIKSVTGASVKYVGVGEKLSDLEVFHPERVAGRILGMGDMLTLIEKAQSSFEAEEAEAMAKKLQKATFDFEDFRTQMRRMKKIDKERTEYHKYFTGRNWMDMENYDLPINASRIDYDQMIKLIKDYLKLRGMID